MSDHHVAFWNLENLFAPEGHPGREPWIEKAMARDLTGWTQGLLDTKVARLASIVGQMKGGAGPDLLGVCEVENAFVLQQLTAALNAALPGRSYDVAHVDSTRDQRGIDTAFVFDSGTFTVDPAAIFSHFVMRRTGTRDITQATFRTAAGNELIALCNHWPSRSGGAYESAGFRMTAGETLSYWQERIQEEKGDEATILAFGDFNDDPFDPSLVIHARATRERGDVERARKARFHDLAWDYLRQDVVDHRGDARVLEGTLYFSGNGNVFDQILVSRGLLRASSPLRIVDGSARIEAFPEMVDHRVSEGPIRFGLPKGDAAKNVNPAGFSDHFPVSVVVREA